VFLTGAEVAERKILGLKVEFVDFLFFRGRRWIGKRAKGAKDLLFTSFFFFFFDGDMEL
jgi:hypothetical protein